jgi:hypothetical protein
MFSLVGFLPTLPQEKFFFGLMDFLPAELG